MSVLAADEDIMGCEQVKQGKFVAESAHLFVYQRASFTLCNVTSHQEFPADITK